MADEAGVADLVAKFEAAGQGHVTQQLASLPPEQAQHLTAQLATIDPARVNALYQRATTYTPPDGGVLTPLSEMAPLEGTAEQRSQWRTRGLAEIAAGHVGTLLLAGGQGTRLGFDHPKGMYQLGLPGKRTLFQLQAQRLSKLQALAAAAAGTASATIYWYVMTSPATDEETRADFEANAFYGLERDQVFFFCQGMLPCVSDEGKIMMESKHSVAMAPNGNGGLYEGLAASGALKHMEEHGVEYVPQYCVDNALVKIADPTFVGYCVEQGAECAAKVVPKAHAHEKVGVIMKRDGRVGVVEYSEIDKETAEATNPDGSLVYSACHLCINYFTRSFFVRAAAEMIDKMPLHVAHKAIPYYDAASDSIIKPDKPNGIKMELFIFDTFPFTERFAALEIDRLEEFAPVKNAPGSASDSPDTAR
jgi:UDP-N-acetylglucosamine/UDP-N-acetylgalactosamine diphosphorylase